MVRPSPTAATLVVLALLQAACATSPRAAAAPDLDRSGMVSQTLQVPGGATTGMNMTDNVSAKRTILDLTPDKAFLAVEQAYLTLGIPVTDRDNGLRRVGNQAFKTRRRIGDVPMLKILDCGGDSGMPNAETYQITLTVMSQVTANDAGGSVLQTIVEGQGKNPITNAANAVRCISVGGLEERIARAVRGK